MHRFICKITYLFIHHLASIEKSGMKEFYLTLQVYKLNIRLFNYSYYSFHSNSSNLFWIFLCGTMAPCFSKCFVKLDLRLKEDGQKLHLCARADGSLSWILQCSNILWRWVKDFKHVATGQMCAFVPLWIIICFFKSLLSMNKRGHRGHCCFLSPFEWTYRLCAEKLDK